MTNHKNEVDCELGFSPSRSEAHYGHPYFHVLAAEETKTHNAKNHDYAKGGDPLGNFKRVAAILSLYPNLNLADPAVVALVYALKQWDAVLWGLAQKIEAKVEGLEPRLGDVSIYAKLARCILHDRGAPTKQALPW